ncbi:MAG: hypothetical protein GTO02_13960 [Candidatus Dadabacteria bacterium]|nr:hypothetical protein [Candidatus Dadabacteria bacterium]NIQ15453.1 hypothetical protein [Candidatus Dadabacteria bacterium]
MKYFAFLILFILSCGNSEEIKPVSINYGQDICERCKMIISEERFSSQILLKDGLIYKFDDLGGMIHYIVENKISMESVNKIYVKDYNTKKWLIAEEAIYVSTDKIKTPMNFALLAVDNNDNALELVSRYNGEIIGNFSRAVSWIEESHK